ncbi:MAG TPA: helix-turn-helix transcriptional regulator [Gemmatimonadaceae bacterium]|nr:helix-turn-helix transcriptional regulator [Gemmatimonadaceae bacterium]
MDTEVTLRERVGGYLTAANISQNELARRCGISPQRMQQILDGQSLPGLALAIRFEDVTGIPVRAFLSAAPAPERVA